MGTLSLQHVLGPHEHLSQPFGDVAGGPVWRKRRTALASSGGALTLLLCLAAASLIPLPLINIFLGLAASFGLMLGLNLMQD
jgi:hypothetical protein